MDVECELSLDDIHQSECELSLDDIHQSIESMLVSIRNKHEQVDAIFGDLPHLKRTVENVLRPLNQKVGLQEIGTLENLKMLLAHCVRSSPPSSGGRKGRLPTPPTKLRSFTRAQSDGRIEKDKSKCATLPPLKSKCLSASNARTCAITDFQANTEEILLPINVNRILRTTLHSTTYKEERVVTEADSKGKPLGLPVIARRGRMIKTREDEPGYDHTDIKRFELNRLVDDFECALRALQETFSSFTQRVLVPLQTFCKQYKNFAVVLKERPGELQGAASQTPAIQESLDKTEFRIVQTMNQIRQLLWPSDKVSIPVRLFCDDHFSEQVGKEIDCARFPVIRLIPDALQKFNSVLSLASIWLKRDVMYVQSAKSALLRAHRRFLKTERLWRQARDTHRHLRGERGNIFGELQSNTARLNAVNGDINNLNQELDRSRKVKKDIEDQLQTTDDAVEPLVARHRSLRKKVIVLSTKIEARERSHGFLQSRVLSLKADQDAVTEKLKISEEYTNNLQNKMEELYGLRDAWSRRYEEKTDQDKLKTRLRLTRIRMPLPSLREKTFILRTGMENLRRALDLVEKRLSANEIHWSMLCDELPWPDSTSSLPLIYQEHRPIAADKSPNVFSKSQRCRSHALRVRDRVLSAHPENEKKQRALMLQLWLEENGKEATVEKLLQALRASDIPSLADSVQRKIM